MGEGRAAVAVMALVVAAACSGDSPTAPPVQLDEATSVDVTTESWKKHREPTVRWDMAVCIPRLRERVVVLHSVVQSRGRERQVMELGMGPCRPGELGGIVWAEPKPNPTRVQVWIRVGKNRPIARVPARLILRTPPPPGGTVVEHDRVTVRRFPRRLRLQVVRDGCDARLPTSDCMEIRLGWRR